MDRLESIINRDILQSEERFSFSARDLISKEFWSDNLSDRFYSSFNFTIPVLIIVILYVAFFVGYAFPSYHKYGEFKANHIAMGILFCVIFAICMLGRSLPGFISDRGANLTEIQNVALLRDQGHYEKYLFRWRWSLLFFFLTLASFSVPFIFLILLPIVASYLFYHQYRKCCEKYGKRQKGIIKDGFKII